MQLLKLDVQNWVHHRRQTCEFTRGLVAILGENGSGKSSLFGAIRWLLTGENPNYGVKLDNISQYAQPGEPAYASLEFEHNGHYAIVTRYLLPEKEQSVLIVDNQEVARGDKSVTAAVEKLLGVDAKFISRFIIVSQTEIFSFIDDSQTDTDKFFQRLFGTSIANKCQDIIGKTLSKISIPEIAVTSAELEKSLSTARESLRAVEAELDAFPSFESYLAMQRQENEILLQWELRSAAQKDWSEQKDSLSAKRGALMQASADLKQCVEDLETLDAASSGGEREHQDALVALAHWENYKKISAVRADITARRDKIEAARALNKKPVDSLSPPEKVLRDRVIETTKRIQRAEKFLATFSSGDVTHCPTCNTPTDQLQHEVIEQRDSLEKAKICLAAEEAEHAQREAFDAEYAAWLREEERLNAQAEEINQSEAAICSVKPPETAEAELQQTVEDFEAFNAAREELRPVIDAAKERVATLKGSVSAAEEAIEKLKDTITSCVVTEADAALSKSKLAAIAKKLSERREIDERRVDLKVTVSRLEDELEAVLAQEKKAAHLRKQVVVAEAARAALKNAPRLVAQRNLKNLEASINELLQIFNVNFSISVSDSNSPCFVAEFYDGRKQVAQRLSIGQKTVLALAFRVAVNAQFAEEIGLLALDEPTASLDAPRIKALAPVLEKLRDLSTAKGLQCLLVTHASSLSHLFESTIQLDPPELRHVSSNG